MRRRVRAKPKFWAILIVLTAALFCIGYCVSRSSLRRAEDRYAQLKYEYVTLGEEIETLQNSILFAQTDEYVRRVARSELGLIMPGEIRYVSGGY